MQQPIYALGELVLLYPFLAAAGWIIHLAVGAAKGHGSLIRSNLSRLYDHVGLLGFVVWHLTMTRYPPVDEGVIEEPEPDAGILHEQYHADGDPVFFRCSVCGYRSQSLGGLHGHIEGHRGFTRYNISIPFTSTTPGDFEALMGHTEIIRIEETAEITLTEVEGF
jgi:hypothetical protein